MNAWAPESLLVLSIGIAAVPLLIAVGTCYLKFSIVLSLLKSGFGTQQTPSAAVVLALSTSMSILVMAPVIDATYDQISAIKPSEIAKLSLTQMLEKGRDVAGPWRDFLTRHAGSRELEVFESLARERGDAASAPSDDPQVDASKADIGVVLMAFVVSEIKQGFLMAFFLLIPFFVIDMVVANVLVGMGLTMMSPVIVSLPLKILLFVSADGWLLMTKSLIRAYQ